MNKGISRILTRDNVSWSALSWQGAHLTKHRLTLGQTKRQDSAPESLSSELRCELCRRLSSRHEVERWGGFCSERHRWEWLVAIILLLPDSTADCRTLGRIFPGDSYAICYMQDKWCWSIFPGRRVDGAGWAPTGRKTNSDVSWLSLYVRFHEF
jgi:hypothetical protein